MIKRMSPGRHSSGGFSYTDHRALFVCLGIFVLVLSMLVIAFPVISNMTYEHMSENDEKEYIKEVERTESTVLRDELALANAYNAALAAGDVLPADYDTVLNLSGTGLMGYIEIPKLNLKLPVCHGTDANTLEAAVGHLSGTALPVGGIGTHCVLTGHSGLASKRLFSDLDTMEVGDIFCLEILGEKLYYEVDDISVILPYELDTLAAVPGKDYCTLVTCTPFGVNTHRLLVRGERIEEPSEGEEPADKNEEKNEPPKNDDVQADDTHSSTWLKKYITVLLLCFGGTGIIAVGAFIFRSLKNKGRRKQ